jgi:hypothetical protein
MIGQLRQSIETLAGRRRPRLSIISVVGRG